MSKQKKQAMKIEVNLLKNANEFALGLHYCTVVKNNNFQ